MTPASLLDFHLAHSLWALRELIRHARTLPAGLRLALPAPTILNVPQAAH